MSQSAEASAETLPPCPLPALPHRQEAFARHVASGRTLTDAARLAGYAWDSARQTGSRLMKEPQIAARVADLTHTNDNQRQGELDELVAGLKRLMIDTMARKNDFAALRAIDMIARLRGLIPTTAKRSDGIDRRPGGNAPAAGGGRGSRAEEAAPRLPDPGSRLRPADAARNPNRRSNPLPKFPNHRPRQPRSAPPPSKRPAPRFAAASSATST